MLNLSLSGKSDFIPNGLNKSASISRPIIQNSNSTDGFVNNLDHFGQAWQCDSIKAGQEFMDNNIDFTDA